MRSASTQCIQAIGEAPSPGSKFAKTIVEVFIAGSDVTHSIGHALYAGGQLLGGIGGFLEAIGDIDNGRKQAVHDSGAKLVADAGSESRTNLVGEHAGEVTPGGISDDRESRLLGVLAIQGGDCQREVFGDFNDGIDVPGGEKSPRLF